MLPIIRQAANEYKAALQSLYGDDLAELILFGSYARGDYWEESDIDFAVIHHNPDIQPTDELFKTVNIGADLSLKYGISFSTLHASLLNKATSMQGIYQEIRKDGVVI